MARMHYLLNLRSWNKYRGYSAVVSISDCGLQH